MRKIVSILILVMLPILFGGLVSAANISNKEFTKIAPGEFAITFVNCPEVGNIAVRVESPNNKRYSDGAPIVINPEGWFVPSAGFKITSHFTEIGALQIDFLWPGKKDAPTGAVSDGTNDYGGAKALAAFRDVVCFACGTKANVDGLYLHEMVGTNILYHNIGIHAFSHSGVMGTNVLCLYGDNFPTIKYFVGRENPTCDEMYALESGHFNDTGFPVHNPFYDPVGYSPDSIEIDYSSVSWVQNNAFPEGNPIFVVENGLDYPVSLAHPEMFGKEYYSRKLIRALKNNNIFEQGEWPHNLPTPEEADSVLLFRRTVQNYQHLSSKLLNLKVMLVFGEKDHVQAAVDKPHIHQAYDGFVDKAGLNWIRLNPDEVYALEFAPDVTGFPDNDANTEPENWMHSDKWGYPKSGRYGSKMSAAGVAEMMDRVQYNNWSENLSQVLRTQTTISEKELLLNNYKLFQNYPNPLNSSTTISYQLSAVSQVELTIYDIIGKKVVTKINENKSPGSYSVVWDGKDDFGNVVSSGMYFYQLKTNENISTMNKMLLIK